MVGLFPRCVGCHAAVAPGEPRWTQREPGELWHWSCAEAAGLTMGPLYGRFMLAAPRLARVHSPGRRPRTLRAMRVGG